MQKGGKIFFKKNPSPNVFLLLLLLSFISSPYNWKTCHSLQVSPMNFQMSPKGKEGRYQDAVLQHGWGTLLILHIHSFQLTPPISHHSQWQLHAWTTSNNSIPDIWASSFHKAGKKKIDYCNVGTVSVLSFRILTSLYLTVTAHIQRWCRNGFPILNPKASHELRVRHQQNL